MSSCIVWFRHDLRLADNPALVAAVQSGLPIVPVYILDESTPGLRGPGAASRWWLHHALAALDADLRALGSRLVLQRGPAETVLPDLVARCGATAVHWNRLYEIVARERDARIKQALTGQGISVTSHKANLLFEPWEVKTGAGDPFKVFTPFWRACRQLPPPEPPLPRPDRLAPPPAGLPGDDLDSWRLLPRRPDWAGGLRDNWTPGEAGAHQRLAAFVDEALPRYRDERDLPARASTSRLSPYLAFGEISPRQVWHAATTREPSAATEKFLAEVGWREFCNNLIFHFGNLAERNFRADFDAFPWAAEDAKVEAWRRGRTGYPIVDAGMRELWATGWMHNRVRMITASFLTKDLMVDWRIGERWFWDTLVDADAANNPAGWQWVSGSGADAQPYFRIFNPVLQGEKFDPDGAYVRHWVPEVAKLPNSTIHRPWTDRARVASGYPEPVVDHAQARDRALAAFRSLKQEP